MTRRATREASRKQTTNKDKKRSCEGEETVTEHPWIKSYPPGVRWDADIPLMPVQQILENSASQWPDNPAVDFMGRKISYRELNDLSNCAASGFQKLGVKTGVHVGLYLPNTPHYLISLFGILKAGGTIVNYSPLDAERVLEHKVEDSETDILVTLRKWRRQSNWPVSQPITSI